METKYFGLNDFLGLGEVFCIISINKKANKLHAEGVYLFIDKEGYLSIEKWKSVYPINKKIAIFDIYSKELDSCESKLYSLLTDENLYQLIDKVRCEKLEYSLYELTDIERDYYFDVCKDKLFSIAFESNSLELMEKFVPNYRHKKRKLYY